MFGGRGADFITGNLGDDVLNGGGGRDRIFGGPGNDTINGGPGVPARRARPQPRRFGDRLHGGDGNDTINGNSGRDLISGGKGDDTSTGGAGNDLIFANLGADKSFGGDGNDELWALARGDVTAPGDPMATRSPAATGNDTFRVRDGEADMIDCGDGSDVVLRRPVDVIVDATPGERERLVRAGRAQLALPDADADENKTQSPKEDGKEA